MISEISQTKKTDTVWYHLDMEPKQYNKLVNITKKTQTQRYRDTKQWLPVGRRKRAGER